MGPLFAGSVRRSYECVVCQPLLFLELLHEINRLINRLLRPDDFHDALGPEVDLLGLVQIGRFLGNTQPQVRTLSGPFI